MPALAATRVRQRAAIFTPGQGRLARRENRKSDTCPKCDACGIINENVYWHRSMPKVRQMPVLLVGSVRTLRSAFRLKFPPILHPILHSLKWLKGRVSREGGGFSDLLGRCGTPKNEWGNLEGSGTKL